MDPRRRRSPQHPAPPKGRPFALGRRGFLRGAAAALATALWPLPGRAAEPRLALSYGGFAMGIQSFTLRHFPLPEMLDRVRQLGLTRVELIPETRVLFWDLGTHFAVTEDEAQIRSVLEAVAARGLRISAHGVNGVGSEDEARRLCGFARRAGIPVLTVHPDEDVLPALDRVLDDFPDVRLAIHNHGPGFAYSEIADVERALAGRHPRLGACVDTGHFIRSGEDPVEALRRLGPRVYGVHLKDFAGAGFFASGTLLGRGRLDLDATFRALREIGFPPDGALSLEYEESPEEPMADVEACLRAASEAALRTARG